ncbi:isopeptide-forming domain-containing fimbrial protein [Bifidobacterium miconisargentati]|uniref:isopeptide-forming domain-containing fimbrial protein n=1 Tax=Bifidobacterium miconisargentati TaxID=2834437 RepID=UPI001BDC3C6C|nr:isopeptide-forming domain-containing fimbrial protein [Bifidobacterium miconisargentati]MBW3089240.1 isopeptide-forming domain-containing fimbrial protein [Bifidobacterium miconisargentati]
MAITPNRTAKRVLAGLVAAASLAIGGIATANAATPTDVSVSGKETITLSATTSGAFTGKTDTIQAIELGKYVSAQSTDGGKTISAVGVETTAAYKQALTDALTAAGVTDIDTANPLNTVLDVTGDNGSEKPAYSSDLRKIATSLNDDATIKAATGEKGTVSSSGDSQTDNVLTFSNLEAGYYLIRDTTAKGATAAIPMLVGTKAGGLSFKDNPLGVVVYKSIDDNKGGNGDGNENVKPPVKSTGDNKGSAEHKVGDTVSYTIKATVPNTTGYKGYRLELSDTLGAGLDYVAKTGYTVKINDKELDAKYVKFTQDQNNARHLTWAFGLDTTVNGATVRNILEGDAATVFTPGSVIEITYTATINSDAVNQDANKNAVVQNYSNNPNAWDANMGSSEGENPDGPGPVDVLLGQADIMATKNLDKTNADAVKNAAGLKGVKFQIGEYTKGGTFTALNFVANADGSYTLADADDTNTVNEFTTPDSGVIVLKGISGDYELKQTGAADGWSDTYLADFVFNAAATKTAKTATLNADQSLNKNGLAFQIDSDTVGFMSVKNKTQLPNTGSQMGTILMAVTILTAAGGAVIAFKAHKHSVNA